MNPREAFLDRVRHAVAEGNRMAGAASLPERGQVGYQGGGANPIERFCTELKNAGGIPSVVASLDQAYERASHILRERAAKSVLLSIGGLVDEGDFPARLRGAGYDLATAESVRHANWRDAFFVADAGVSNVEYLIAETGSVVMATRPAEPRSVSLLPPLHIAVARSNQILPDLFDLFDVFSPVADLSVPPPLPPSCLTLITGPSKTGDIELKLVTGVHGPGELHVIVIDAPAAL